MGEIIEASENTSDKFQSREASPSRFPEEEVKLGPIPTEESMKSRKSDMDLLNDLSPPSNSPLKVKSKTIIQNPVPDQPSPATKLCNSKNSEGQNENGCQMSLTEMEFLIDQD